MSDTAAELLRIAGMIERWARYDDGPGPGLSDAEILRNAAEQATQLRGELAAIVTEAEVTNFNSDGDELTGCRWCDTLWGHSEGCPIGRIEQVLGV